MTLSGTVVHQIRDVLRFRAGDRIVVLDDSGWEYTVRLTAVEHEHASGQIEQKVLSRTEPRAKLTLYQSMLKGQNFEWVLQKGTELGIVEFVPMVSDRCVIASLDDVSKTKFERWQRIILEAAEQSRRGRLPRLHPPLLFSQACERASHADLALLPWEGHGLVAQSGTPQSHRSETGQAALRSLLADSNDITVRVQGKAKVIRKPFSIHLFIGPEGGWSPREVDQARRYGLIPVSLGPRILRAETAGLVAATIILYQLGDI